MEVVISDDEPEIIEHHPQQEVQQLQQQQQLHPHELSLQDRLRNLAGNISISNSFNLLNEKLNFMSGRRSDVNRINDWPDEQTSHSNIFPSFFSRSSYSTTT